MKEIARLLTTRGFKVWSDENLQHGSSAWRETIEESIENSDHMLVLLSPYAKKSKWVEREVTIAQWRHKRIVPVLLAGERQDSIPLYLAEKSFVDVRTGRDELIRFARRLVAASAAGSKSRQSLSSLDGLDRPSPVSGDVWEETLTGMTFVWVPAGTLRIGDSRAYEESPEHTVSISKGFWLARHPTTNFQYQSYLEDCGLAVVPLPKGFAGPQQPVIQVSRQDAIGFCEWLTSKLPKQMWADLPTEAEWEWASRGRDGRQFPWGNQALAGNMADYGQDPSDGNPKPVGSHRKGAGPFGAEGQVGTVWEICKDHWRNSSDMQFSTEEVDPLYYQPFTVDSAREPSVVIRGGCWASVPGMLGCSVRASFDPESADEFVGFRVACRLQADKPVPHPVPDRHLEAAIINNSFSSTLDEAVLEWKLKIIGRSNASLCCEACGQSILRYALLANRHTSAQISLGLTCYQKLLRHLYAQGLSNPKLQNRHRKRKFEKQVTQMVLVELRRASEWKLPEIDYGSWKKWYLDQNDKGLLPKQLSRAVAELRRSGLLESKERVGLLVRYHNSTRRFPACVLLPYLRLRALFEYPLTIPISLTVDQAVRFSRRGKSKDELGVAILDRLARILAPRKRQLGYRLRTIYNFLICFYRGWKGLASDEQRKDFIRESILLRRNPALATEVPGSALSVLLDDEVAATVKVLAELLVDAFRQGSSGDQYLQLLASRVARMSDAGHVQLLWPLAGTGEPLRIERENEVATLSECYAALFARRNIAATVDFVLSQEAEVVWKGLHSQGAPCDITIVAGWIDTAFSISSVVVVWGRQTTFLGIGLGSHWRSQDASARRAVLEVMLRDLEGLASNPAALGRFQEKLRHRGLASLQSERTPEARRALARLGWGARPEMQAWFPMVIADPYRRSVFYDRWSHSLFVPIWKLEEPSDAVISLPKNLISMHTLSPPRLPHPKRTKREARVDEDRRRQWYQLDFSWIQPDAEDIGLSFCHTFFLGLPPSYHRVADPRPDLLTIVSRVLGKPCRVQRGVRERDETDVLDYAH